MQALKSLYHALVPDRIRYPIGFARRAALDSWRRCRIDGPLPPRSLLQKVQMTPWIDEYLTVGQKSWDGVVAALQDAGAAPSAPLAAVDFGCGLGRTLRFAAAAPEIRWRLAGCDVDPRLVDWSRAAFPELDIRLNDIAPPLPWADNSFDVLWSVSVFTHFDERGQDLWAAELARLLRPGGLAAVTSMGPHAFGGFPNLDTPSNRARFEAEGFFFHAGGDTFNANGAFHTEERIGRIFEAGFELLSWTSGGLDGFQDLSVLRRRAP